MKKKWIWLVIGAFLALCIGMSVFKTLEAIRKAEERAASVPPKQA